MSTGSGSLASSRPFNAHSIRDVQYRHLVDMLNFNLPDTDPTRPVWKLFIMDQTAQRIVSPILKVNDLREQGVTLFLQLQTEREPVDNVPAVYLVEPTEENISRIGKDLRMGLYGSYHVNFTSYVSRDGLERLAQEALQSQSHNKIARIYDQYISFVSLEDNLFSLEIPRVFLSAMRGEGRGNGGLADRLALDLFSVLLSFGGPAPILCTVRLPPAGPAEDGDTLAGTVVSRLEARIKAHLINTKSLMSLGTASDVSSSPSSQQRPLLIVVDRTVDLASPIKHSAAYNALIADILGLDSNRVVIPEHDGKKPKRVFDIDMRDGLWRANAARPFPTVAENVESALRAYKADYDRVLQTTPGMTEDMIKSADGGAETALTPEQLKVAINVLPELTERKRLIDMHLQVSTALLEAIKTRDLGNLFHLEQTLPTLAPAALLGVLRDPKAGNVQDKLRLFLLFYLQHGGQRAEIGEMAAILQTAGCDMRPFEYIRGLVSTGALSAGGLATANALPVSPGGASVARESATPANSDFLSRLTAGTALGGALLSGLVTSVKNLLPVASESPLTRLVDAAYALSTGNPPASLTTSVMSSYLRTAEGMRSSPHSPPGGAVSGGVLLDASHLTLRDPRPKQAQTQHAASLYSVDHVMLFVVGGASYSEYDHLLDHFAKSRVLQNLRFTFGVTEMLTADKFLKQLAELAGTGDGSDLL